MKQLQINKNIIKVLEYKQKKHKEVCKENKKLRDKLYHEMKQYFKQNCYWIFFRTWGTEENVQKALEITRYKNKGFNYFLGTLKALNK